MCMRRGSAMANHDIALLIFIVLSLCVSIGNALIWAELRSKTAKLHELQAKNAVQAAIIAKMRPSLECEAQREEYCSRLHVTFTVNDETVHAMRNSQELSDYMHTAACKAIDAMMGRHDCGPATLRLKGKS